MAIRNWPSSYIIVLWIFGVPLLLVGGTALLVELLPLRVVSVSTRGGALVMARTIPPGWVMFVLVLAVAVPGLITLWWRRVRARPSDDNAAT